MNNLKLVLVLSLVILTNNIFAQDILQANTGSTITIENGGVVIVKGDVPLADGSLVSNAGTITIASPVNGTANLIDNTVKPL